MERETGGLPEKARERLRDIPTRIIYTTECDRGWQKSAKCMGDTWHLGSNTHRSTSGSTLAALQCQWANGRSMQHS